MTAVTPTPPTAPAQPAKPTPPAATAAPQPPAAHAGHTHPGLAPETIAERTEKGRVAEYTADVLPPEVVERGAPAYFRTYEQLKSAMYALQQQYPDLVQVRDIGDSWEKTQGKADRDILALTLGNKQRSGPKPVALHLGGVHAREIANPELLMKFATQLLEGYGRDPEATAILDTREIDLIPMVNPDGHAYVERAYARQPQGDFMKRKNASGAGGEGVDINRNFEFHWGGPGASASPRSETYRGPSAASEPETRAVDAWVAARRPNVFVDWHSYSRLNMYPWGDTREKTPHHEGFKKVAEKFSTFNHYSPIQAVQLYPTTGTTDDNAYGKYGVPAWAVETGDSFHQSDKEFAQTLAENLPVLWYAAKIADDPFARVNGPDTLDVNVTAGSVPGVSPKAAAISATISDATSGAQALRAAEWTTDPASTPGSGAPLQAADGSFDSPTEQVTGQVPNGASHSSLVYVRAQDANGNWGPPTAQWIGDAAARK